MIPPRAAFAYCVSVDRLFCLRHISFTLFGKWNKYISYFLSNGILQCIFFPNIKLKKKPS